MEAEIIEAEGTELAVREAYVPAKVVGGIPYLGDFIMLAERVCRTAMVPTALRNKPDEVLAVVLYGSELGIGPMQALQQINFIAGKPSASAELLRALVMEQGHQFILTSDETGAVAQCKRKDWTEFREVTFTMADAARAGLTGGDGWRKYPDQMCAARVTSKACRMFFPDVISGMSYTPEEVESFTETPPPPARTSSEAPSSPLDAPVPRPMSEDTPIEIASILKASALASDPKTEEFLGSLANQWHTKGSLSPRQLASGAKAAGRVLMDHADEQADREGDSVDTETGEVTGLEPFPYDYKPGQEPF